MEVLRRISLPWNRWVFILSSLSRLLLALVLLAPPAKLVRQVLLRGLRWWTLRIPICAMRISPRLLAIRYGHRSVLSCVLSGRCP